MRFVIALVVLVGLAGCATEAGFRKILQSWIGAPEEHLITSWGVPDGSYETKGGVKFLTYRSNRSVHLPGTAPSFTTTYIGNTAYTTQSGGSPAQSVHLHCKTTFRVVEGIVRGAEYQGNDCTARE